MIEYLITTPYVTAVAVGSGTLLGWALLLWSLFIGTFLVCAIYVTVTDRTWSGPRVKSKVDEDKRLDNNNRCEPKH